MPLFMDGVEGGAGTTMAPLGAALALVPKFNGSNISLSEWEERLYQVPIWLIAELTINSLEDVALHAVMVLLENSWASLEQIAAWMGGLFEEDVTETWICHRQTAGGQKPHLFCGSPAKGSKRLENMVAPSLVVDSLENDQMVPCLIDTGSGVTVMEYESYVQQFRTQDQLDSSWLSLKVAKNLPIMVEEFTWVKIQIYNQLLKRVRVLFTHSPVNSAVLIVLEMIILKDLDLPPLLAKTELC